MLYFAYGSNLSSARLRSRVGEVGVEGVAELPGHEHRFSKLGADGTGKGNVRPHAYRRVHGVLYRLSDRQLEHLTTFEGGYRRVQVSVHHGTPTGPFAVTGLTAVTFVALDPCHPPPPSAPYLDHYRDGFVEHCIPPAYALAVLRDAGDLRALIHPHIDDPPELP